MTFIRLLSFLSHSWSAIASFSIRGRMNFFHYVYKSFHLQWQLEQQRINTSDSAIILLLLSWSGSIKSRFLWTLTELQDYFKDGDVRSAHVLPINNVGLGDRALSFRRLSSVSTHRERWSRAWSSHRIFDLFYKNKKAMMRMPSRSVVSMRQAAPK